MPRVHFNNQSITVERDVNLRRALLDHDLPVYNGTAKYLNCHGLGTCGTCCVFLKGEVSPMTKVEKWRLNFPPHKGESGKRLACQVKVIGDVEIEKGDGFWGEENNKE